MSPSVAPVCPPVWPPVAPLTVSPRQPSRLLTVKYFATPRHSSCNLVTASLHSSHSFARFAARHHVERPPLLHNLSSHYHRASPVISPCLPDMAWPFTHEANTTQTTGGTALHNQLNAISENKVSCRTLFCWLLLYTQLERSAVLLDTHPCLGRASLARQCSHP